MEGAICLGLIALVDCMNFALSGIMISERVIAMTKRQDRKTKRQGRINPDFAEDQLGENKYEAFEDYEEFAEDDETLNS